MQLMMSKLIGMKLSNEMTLSDRQCMAILGMIVSVEISATSILASDLAAGNMRLVAGVSEDRHLVYDGDIRTRS
jgi:hypothetical protein